MMRVEDCKIYHMAAMVIAFEMLNLIKGGGGGWVGRTFNHLRLIAQP